MSEQKPLNAERRNRIRDSVGACFGAGLIDAERRALFIELLDELDRLNVPGAPDPPETFVFRWAPVDESLRSLDLPTFRSEHHGGLRLEVGLLSKDGDIGWGPVGIIELPGDRPKCQPEIPPENTNCSIMGRLQIYGALIELRDKAATSNQEIWYKINKLADRYKPPPPSPPPLGERYGHE